MMIFLMIFANWDWEKIFQIAKIILNILPTFGVLIIAIGSALKLSKNIKVRKLGDAIVNFASNSLLVRNKMLYLIQQAEKFTNFSGEQKKNWVSANIKDFCISNNIKYDSDDEILSTIEKYIIFATKVNGRDKEQKKLANLKSNVKKVETLNIENNDTKETDTENTEIAIFGIGTQKIQDNIESEEQTLRIYEKKINNVAEARQYYCEAKAGDYDGYKFVNTNGTFWKLNDENNLEKINETENPNGVIFFKAVVEAPITVVENTVEEPKAVEIETEKVEVVEIPTEEIVIDVATVGNETESITIGISKEIFADFENSIIADEELKPIEETIPLVEEIKTTEIEIKVDETIEPIITEQPTFVADDEPKETVEETNEEIKEQIEVAEEEVEKLVSNQFDKIKKAVAEHNALIEKNDELEEENAELKIENADLKEEIKSLYEKIAEYDELILSLNVDL